MDITELKAIIDANIFENTSQAITGDALNDVLNLIADSLGEYVPVADIFDEAGTIRSALLPSYVDDVLEFSTRDAFPAVGEGGKIYLAADTNLSYRWGGSEYVIIAQSLALGETSSTAYRGDRGKIAYDHSQTSHRLSIAGLEVSALGGAIATDALASALSIPELRNSVTAHIGDGNIHITADERTAWNKIASLFGIDDSGDIYIKADENGRNRGLYSYSFVSSAGKSDTPGTGGGTVVGANIDGVEVPLSDGILSFPAYPTAASLGLGNIAFKNSLVIADISNLQSTLDGKQAVISDLVTIRNNASNGATAYSWGNHASAGYALASNLAAHTGNSTIHITAAERTSWNNKYDKPASGIPYTDLADSVKSALDKAHEHANKTSVLDKLKWNEDKKAIYIGDENNRINFFVYGGVSSGGFSDAGGAGGGTVTGIKIGADDIITPVDGILNIPPYPTTTSLGLKSLAFKDSLAVSEIVGLQSALNDYVTLATNQTISGAKTFTEPIWVNNEAGYYQKDSSHSLLMYIGYTKAPENMVQLLNALANTSIRLYDAGGCSITTPLSVNTSVSSPTFYENGVALSNKYLALTGGTMTGNIILNSNAIIFNTNNTSSWENPQNSGIRILNNVGASTSGRPASYTCGLSVSGYYGFQIATNHAAGNELMFRNTRNGVDTPYDWVTLYHSGNLTASVIGGLGTLSNNISGNAAYATSAGSAPASDVYAWAKASTKPSYTTTEVSEGTNLYFTNARAISALSGTLANYLPLSGGTMTGTLTLPYGNGLRFGNSYEQSNTWDVAQKGSNSGITILNSIGISGTSAPSGYAVGLSVSGYYLMQIAAYGAGNKFWMRANAGEWKELYHSGNCNNTSTPWTCSNLTASGNATIAGNVGIGTTEPSAKLHINGNILATGAVTAGQASDARLKSNIVTVMNACGILRGLRGVEFDWNAIATENCKDLTGHDVGLIAQEVESLIPSAIGTIWGEYKRLDYTKITPYLVEGWKAHENEIQRLKAKINKLEERIYGMGR